MSNQFFGLLYILYILIGFQNLNLLTTEKKRSIEIVIALNTVITIINILRNIYRAK